MCYGACQIMFDGFCPWRGTPSPHPLCGQFFCLKQSCKKSVKLSPEKYHPQGLKMAFLHQIRLKNKRKMDQIELKINGVNGVFGPKIPVFWRTSFRWTWGVFPSPHLRTIFLTNNFWGIWGVPPPPNLQNPLNSIWQAPLDQLSNTHVYNSTDTESQMMHEDKYLFFLTNFF